MQLGAIEFLLEQVIGIIVNSALLAARSSRNHRRADGFGTR